MTSPSLRPASPGVFPSISAPSAPSGEPTPLASPLARALLTWSGRQRRWDEASSVEERRALAAELPLSPDPHPEVHAAQCALLLAAWPLLDRPRLPDWRGALLPAPSFVRWARLSLLVAPADTCAGRAEALPWEAILHGIDLAAAPSPARVIEALLGLDEPAAQRLVRREFPQMVRRGHVAAAEASAWALAQLAHPEVTRRVAAFRLLAEPWALAVTPPLPRWTQALRPDSPDAEALAAIEAAGLRGRWAVIAPSLASPSLARRQRALSWAGELAGRGEIEALLESASTEPVALGGAALAALVAMHHRGVFVREEQVPEVLSLAVTIGPGPIAPDDLAGLLFVTRHDTLARLASLDADDADWLVLAPVVAAWLRAPRPPAEAAGCLLRLARESRRPATVVSALSLLRELALDHDLHVAPLGSIALARLADYPAEALALLEAVAGPDHLGAVLRWTERHQHHALFSRALALTWRLATDEQRASLLDRVPAALWPAPVLASLTPAPSARAREVIRHHRGHGSREAAFRALCESATPDDLADLREGLLRLVEEGAAAAPEPSAKVARARRLAHSPGVGSSEETRALGDSVVAAVASVEARWRERGEGPAWLLQSRGPRLLPELVARNLARDDLPVAARVLLMHTLLDLGHPRSVVLGVEALAHRDHEVARMGARLLARQGAPWLSLELSRGASSPDDRRARACMEAMGKEGGAWALPTLLEGLERGTMNLKKTAAEALASLATPSCLPALLRWLARHDNPGLREALTRALDRAVGTGRVAAVLLAMQATDDAPQLRNLAPLLDGQIDPNLARALLRSPPSPWRDALLGALAREEIRLVGGSRETLRAEFQAAGYAVPSAPRRAPPTPVDALAALEREGWSDERAREVLSALAGEQTQEGPALTATSRDLLRRELRGWTRLLLGGDLRAAPVLAAALASRPTPAEAWWLTGALPALLRQFEEVPPGARRAWVPLWEALVPWLPVHEQAAVGEAVRRSLDTLSGLARSPLALLRSCGLVLTRRDLELALEAARGGSDPAALLRSTLEDAFGQRGAPLPAGRLPAGTSLRESAAGERGDEQVEARAWAERLDAAVRREEPRELWNLRLSWPLAQGATLGALIHAFPEASRAGRGALLDWMEALRPVGVDAWPWPAPEAARGKEAPARAQRPGGWHEARLAALVGPFAVGRGAVDLMAFLPEEVMAHVTTPEAAARLVHWLSTLPRELVAPYRERASTIEPLLHGDSLRETWAALCVVPAATGEWSVEVQRRKRAEWERYWTTPREIPRAASEADEAQRARWRDEARGTDAEVARRALSRLAEAPDAGWRELVMERASAGETRVRLHAWRLIRKTLGPADAVEVARGFLEHDDPSVRRLAIRSVGFRRDAASLDRLAARLLDPVSWVASAAREALVLSGEDGANAVQRARAHARPDEARRLVEAWEGPPGQVTHAPRRRGHRGTHGA